MARWCRWSNSFSGCKKHLRFSYDMYHAMASKLLQNPTGLCRTSNCPLPFENARQVIDTKNFKAEQLFIQPRLAHNLSGLKMALEIQFGFLSHRSWNQYPLSKTLGSLQPLHTCHSNPCLSKSKTSYTCSTENCPICCP